MPSSSLFANCNTVRLTSLLPLVFLTIGNVSALNFSSVTGFADLVTSRPSTNPTIRPTSGPSNQPSYSPTQNPSSNPTLSALPTIVPSGIPSSSPSDYPTSLPSLRPSQPPTLLPSTTSSFSPSSFNASDYPSSLPTPKSSYAPSEEKVLTEEPTLAPTKMRTTASPTATLSKMPTEQPTQTERLPPKIISSLVTDDIPTTNTAKPLSSQPSFAPLQLPPLTKNITYYYFLTLPSSEIMDDKKSFETATFQTVSDCKFSSSESFNVTSVIVTSQKLTVKGTDLVVYFSILGTLDAKSSDNLSTLNAELTSCFEYGLTENIDRATGIYGLLDDDHSAPEETQSKFPILTVCIIAGSSFFAIAAILIMFMLSRKRRNSKQKTASAKLDILQNMEDADSTMLGKDFEHAKETSLSLDNMSSFSLSIEEGNMRTPTEKQEVRDFELQIDTTSVGGGQCVNVGMKVLSPLDRSYSTGVRTHKESSNILCSPMKAQSPSVLCMTSNHDQSPYQKTRFNNYDEMVPEEEFSDADIQQNVVEDGKNKGALYGIMNEVQSIMNEVQSIMGDKKVPSPNTDLLSSPRKNLSLFDTTTNSGSVDDMTSATSDGDTYGINLPSYAMDKAGMVLSNNILIEHQEDHKVPNENYGHDAKAKIQDEFEVDQDWRQRSKKAREKRMQGNLEADAEWIDMLELASGQKSSDGEPVIDDDGSFDDLVSNDGTYSSVSSRSRFSRRMGD